MNDLECKTENCNEIVMCAEEVVAVTWYMCCTTISMSLENNND